MRAPALRRGAGSSATACVDPGEADGSCASSAARNARAASRVAEPAAHQHLRERVRHAELALQPRGGGEVVGGRSRGAARAPRRRYGRAPDGTGRANRLAPCASSTSPRRIQQLRRKAPGVPAHRDRVRRPRRRRGRRSRRCSASSASTAARRRGLGGRGVHALRHPQLDPRRRALALQLDDPGRARADDRRAAAELVLRRRASLLDFTAKARRRRGRRRRGRGRARRGSGTTSQPLRHRARAHRPRRVLRRARLHGPGPGRDRRGDAAGCATAACG